MAFPTTGILDDFSGTLSGWTNSAYGDSAVTLTGGQITGPAADTGGLGWNGGDYGPDVEVYCTVATASDTLTLHARNDGAGAAYNGYLLRTTTAGAWTIRKAVAGAPSVLATGPVQALSSGDKVGLEIVGNLLTAYYKPAAGAWTSQFSISDSTYTAAGKFGIELVDSTIRVDEFGGGTVAVVQPTVMLTMGMLGMGRV